MRPCAGSDSFVEKLGDVLPPSATERRLCVILGGTPTARRRSVTGIKRYSISSRLVYATLPQNDRITVGERYDLPPNPLPNAAYFIIEIRY